MRRADEQPAVASGRRLPVEGDQTIVQHVARFLERHRADVAHRPQIGQRLQHALRPMQAAPGDRTEALDPFAPGRLFGPLGERIDDRQRELPQVRQVPEIALEPGDARRLGLFFLQRLDSAAVVGGEPVEPAPPPRLAVLARAPADDRRFDDQLFPFPRRPQRAGDDRFVVRVDRLIGGADRRVSQASRSESSGRSPVLVGLTALRRAAAIGAAAGRWLADARHLAKRQILVEPLGGQAVDGAREQRDERAARRIRPARAAIEVDRHAAPRARMLEQPEVLLRSAKKYGHLVERHTAAGLVEHAADDFHRFAAFARRGEQHDVAGALALGRTLGLEHVPAQTIQI